MYLIFGTLTTAVNIVVYYLFSNIIHINYLFSNAVAWFLSVLFAYVTNRKYVFDSKNSIIYTIYEHILYMIKRKE